MNPLRWILFTLVLICIGTVLQVVGVVTPMWIYLVHSDFDIAVGLFYRVGCETIPGGVCAAAIPHNLPFHYTADDTFDRSRWVGIAALQILAAFIAVILLVLMVCYYRGFGVWKKMRLLNTVMFIASILVWLPIGVSLIVFAVYHGKVITRSPGISPASFPWSALLCFIAGLLFVAVTILIKLACRHRTYVKHVVPSSADSKLALNASLRTGVVNKYFSPDYSGRHHGLKSSAYHSDQTHLIAGGHTDYRGVHSSELNHNRSLDTVDGHFERQDGRHIQDQRMINTANTSRHHSHKENHMNSGLKQHHTDRSYIEKYQPVVSELGRRQQDREKVQYVETEHGLVTSNVVLDRHNHSQPQGLEYNTDDAETIYYTGNGQHTSKDYSFENKRLSGRSFDANDESFVNTREVVTKEICTVPSHHELLARKPLSSPKQDFRIGAGQEVLEGGVTSIDQVMVHTRKVEGFGSKEKIIITPSTLEHGDFKYNSTYIYRPYSEQIY